MEMGPGEEEAMSPPHLKQHPRKSCALAGLAAAVAALALVVATFRESHHTIYEGSVGIYFRFGALGKDVSYPGVHWQMPFVSRVEEVMVRPKTDNLESMEAVTKDGITNTFNDIQVERDEDR